MFNQYNDEQPAMMTPQLAVQDGPKPVKQRNNESIGEATVNKIDKAPHLNHSFCSNDNRNSSMANIGAQNLGPMSITSIQK